MPWRVALSAERRFPFMSRRPGRFFGIVAISSEAALGDDRLGVGSGWLERAQHLRQLLRARPTRRWERTMRLQIRHFEL
jgi:hypothetical protein